jgi:hypothetical protein
MMIIKATDSLDKIRRLVVPGKIDIETWHDLKANKETEVLDDVGIFFIKYGYAIEIKPKIKVVDNG